MAVSSTKRALIAVAVLACLAAAGVALYLHHSARPLPAASSGTAPGILDELPPDAPAVAYVDVAALRKLQNSPLSDLLGLTGTAPSGTRGETMDPDYAQFVRGTGFDYTRDLDRTAIAFWPNDLTPAANEAGENPSLAIAEGRFDQRKIDSYALRAGGRSEVSDGRSVYIVPGKPNVAFEFLSPTRIAIASGKHPETLLNFPTNARAVNDPAAQARVQRVAGAPMFGVADTSRLPAGFYANFKNSPQLESVVRSIRSLSLSGQPRGDQIHLALDAECSSMTKAIELSALLDTFRVFGAMSLSDPKMRRQMQMTREQAAFLEALIQQAKLSHQDRWVRITLDITPDMLGAPQPPHRGRKAH
jgi:hypothetical protein